MLEQHISQIRDFFGSAILIVLLGTALLRLTVMSIRDLIQVWKEYR